MAACKHAPDLLSVLGFISVDAADCLIGALYDLGCVSQARLVSKRFRSFVDSSVSDLNFVSAAPNDLDEWAWPSLALWPRLESISFTMDPKGGDGAPSKVAFFHAAIKKFMSWVSSQSPSSLEKIKGLSLEWPDKDFLGMVGPPYLTPACVGALAAWLPNLQALHFDAMSPEAALPADTDQLLGIVRGGLDRLTRLQFLTLPDLSPLGVLQPLQPLADDDGARGSRDRSSSGASSSDSGSGSDSSRAGGLQSRLLHLFIRRLVTSDEHVFATLTPAVAAGIASLVSLRTLSLVDCFAHDDTASLLRLLEHAPPSLTNLLLDCKTGIQNRCRSCLEVVLEAGEVAEVAFTGRLCGAPRPLSNELPALGPLAAGVLLPYLQARRGAMLRCLRVRYLGLQAWANGSPALLAAAELDAVREVVRWRSREVVLEAVCVSTQTPPAWVQHAAEVLRPPQQLVLQGGPAVQVRDYPLFILGLPMPLQLQGAAAQPPAGSAEAGAGTGQQQQQQQQAAADPAAEQLGQPQEQAPGQAPNQEQEQEREEGEPTATAATALPPPRALLARAAARVLALPPAAAPAASASAAAADPPQQDGTELLVLRGPLISGLVQAGRAGVFGWVCWLGIQASQLAPSVDGEEHQYSDWEGAFQLLPEAAAIMLRPDDRRGAAAALDAAVRAVTPDAQLDARWVQAPSPDHAYLPGPLVYYVQEEILAACRSASVAAVQSPVPAPPPPLEEQLQWLQQLGKALEAQQPQCFDY